MDTNNIFLNPHKKDKTTWAPLFDRLIDENPKIDHEHLVKKHYDKAQTLQSIQRDVSIILNTRSTAKVDDYQFHEKHQDNFGLPQMFGIPEAFSKQVTEQSTWPMIAQRCKSAIERFEPRLKNVKVTIDEFFEPGQSVFLKISGRVMFNESFEEIYFPVTLNLL